MSQFKINSITDKSGTSGPVIAGVSTNNSTGCMIIPTGNNSNRVGVSTYVLNETDPLADSFIEKWNAWTGGKIAALGWPVALNLEWTDGEKHTATLVSDKFPAVNFLFSKRKTIVDGHKLVVISVLIKKLDRIQRPATFWPGNGDGIDTRVFTEEQERKLSGEGIRMLKAKFVELFPHQFVNREGPLVNKISFLMNWDDVQHYRKKEDGEFIVLHKAVN